MFLESPHKLLRVCSAVLGLDPSRRGSLLGTLLKACGVSRNTVSRRDFVKNFPEFLLKIYLKKKRAC